MSVGIGAGGIMGIALEITPGTYVAPTKFFPFQSETLKWTQDTQLRRSIRQSADVIGAVQGNGHVEGDVTIEALHDVVPYFHHCSRATVTKTGAAAPFSYAYVPSSAASPPNKTMSITVVRNGQVFGYTGCSVSSFTYSIQNGMLQAAFSMVGLEEASQTPPVATWPTSAPFGAGSYSIEIPTTTQVFDADGFSFQVEDNGEAQNRLKNTLGAQFVKYGERNTQLTTERDFVDRTEYDAFKALTSQSITITTADANGHDIIISMPATIKTDYAVNIGGQGDLLRASITYQGTIDASGNSYTLTVDTTEDIT